MRAVCESFQLAKDAGFKVIAHMMPDLPNVDLERDINQFKVMLLHVHIAILIYTIFFLINIYTFISIFRNFSRILHFEQMD